MHSSQLSTYLSVDTTLTVTNQAPGTIPISASILGPYFHHYIIKTRIECLGTSLGDKFKLEQNQAYKILRCAIPPYSRDNE